MGAAGFLITLVAYISIVITWCWFVLYNWLWLGLVHSTTIGWGIGFGILFVVFVFVITPILFIVGLLMIAIGAEI